VVTRSAVGACVTRHHGGGDVRPHIGIHAIDTDYPPGIGISPIAEAKCAQFLKMLRRELN
jgi:hypothetical protein